MEISRNPTIGYEGENSQRRIEKNESFVKSPGSDQKVRDGTNPSNLYDYLRCLRLQILGYLIAWREPTERRKVAIYNRHWSALYHVMLHMIPLSGAVVLLILNWSCFFIGSDFGDAIWLQFVAKFHELLMQTSIAEIVLAIVREHLINGYLPLGALSAATQSYQISYLWSLDFFSSITSREIPASGKVIYATLVPLLVMLTAVVGPSTATLMIPRSNMPQLLKVLKQASLLSKENMFPSQVRLTAEANVNIDSFAWTTQDDSIMAGVRNDNHINPRKNPGRYERTVYNSDLSNSPRKIRISIGQRNSLAPSLDDNATFFSATATMPTQSVVRGMRRLEKGMVRTRNASISVNIPHPVVATKCTPPKYYMNSATNVTYIQDDGKSQATLSTVSELLNRLLHQNATGLLSDSLPPIWSQFPELNSSALIGTFIIPWEEYNSSCGSTDVRSYPATQMFSTEYEPVTEDCFQLITCNIQAFWKLSLNEITYTDQTPVAQTPLVSDSEFDRIYQEKPITLNLTDMASFNNGSFTSILPSEKYGPVEDILSAVFVNALANGPDTDFFPRVNDDDYYTTFEFRAIQYGYGYDTSPISVRLSMAVIALYCLVTVTYILYILTVGYTSTSWSTAIELILLALQSKRPEGLKNVSAGADSMLTYQKSVGIRVNERHELALVFPNEPDTKLGRMRKVVPNRFY